MRDVVTRGLVALDQRANGLAGQPASSVRWGRGMSLIEMMLAIILFAVGTVAVIEVMQRAQAGTTDGENVLIATQLAQRRLEELRNVAYGSLTNESKTSISSPSGFSRFSRQVDITTPYTNLKQVVVTIYWTAVGGETSVALRTYRSNV